MMQVRRSPLRPRMDQSLTGRGVSLNQDNLDIIPAHVKLRPTGLKMIVEVLDTVFSRYLIVKSGDKPMRGIVKAIGPGENPKKYDQPRRFAGDNSATPKRSKFVYSSRFQAPTVKIGDIVNLGGYENRGYSFPSFIWGDKLHIHAHENDVCFIEGQNGT